MSGQIDWYVKAENVLGEGPCWDGREGVLVWLDIRRRTLESVDPKSGERRTRPLPVEGTAVAIRNEPGLLIASAGELGVLGAGESYERRLLLHAEPAGNRTNDGNTSANGQFWFGTMDNAEEAASGTVYALSSDWTLERKLTGLRIPNALVSSPDGRRIYIADSARGQLTCYAVDPATGALGDVLATTSTLEDGCYPDGAAVDEEGYVWNAQWDGWRIVRYTPDLQIDRIIQVPVARPTSCAFGGDKLDTLFITSARTGLSTEELEKQPLAGSLLAVKPGVVGSPIPLFQG